MASQPPPKPSKVDSTGAGLASTGLATGQTVAGQSFAAGNIFLPRTERRLITYTFLESDLKNITRLNGWSLFLITFGSFWLSIFFGLLFGWLYSDNPTDAAILVTKVGCVVSGGASVVSYGFASYFVRRRQSDIEDVKKEHRVIQKVES